MSKYDAPYSDEAAELAKIRELLERLVDHVGPDAEDVHQGGDMPAPCDSCGYQRPLAYCNACLRSKWIEAVNTQGAYQAIGKEAPLDLVPVELKELGIGPSKMLSCVRNSEMEWAAWVDCFGCGCVCWEGRRFYLVPVLFANQWHASLLWIRFLDRSQATIVIDDVLKACEK